MNATIEFLHEHGTCGRTQGGSQHSSYDYGHIGGGLIEIVRHRAPPLLSQWPDFLEDPRTGIRIVAAQATLVKGTPMSALGQKRTSGLVQSISALPPKADVLTAGSD